MRISTIRWKAILTVPLVVAFLALTGCPSPNGSNGPNGEPDLSWHIETVDPDGGSYTSITLDGNGFRSEGGMKINSHGVGSMPGDILSTAKTQAGRTINSIFSIGM